MRPAGAAVTIGVVLIEVFGDQVQVAAGGLAPIQGCRQHGHHTASARRFRRLEAHNEEKKEGTRRRRKRKTPPRLHDVRAHPNVRSFGTLILECKGRRTLE